MATAAQVLKAALQRILVQGSEAEFEPDEFQDAIFAMNNYMLDLDVKGITLGYTLVSDLGDDVTVPTGALRGVIANVAIEVAPDYNGVISPALVQAAAEGLATMRLLGQHIPTMRMPGTLPVGSGNEGGRGFGRAHHFYPDLEAEILAETTGAIGLEVNTVSMLEAEPDCPTLGSFITISEALTEFNAVEGSTSSEQSYNVSGTNLTDDILIAVPIDWEISLTSGSGFGSTVLVGAATTIVYVRFSRSTSGISTGNIVHTSPGATTESIAIVGATAQITITGTLAAFDTPLGVPSTPESYTVQGVGLHEGITVTAPDHYEVGGSVTGPWFDSIVLLVLGPFPTTVTATVFARLNDNVAGTYSGDITHDTQAATQQLQPVTGTVNP